MEIFEIPTPSDEQEMSPTADRLNSSAREFGTDKGLEIPKEGFPNSAGVFEERVGTEERITADNLAAARRLRNFPDRNFLADFLRLQQAGSLTSSYDFITRTSPDDSDLAYMRQPSDIEYQPDYLYQHYPDRTLHQLGSQCYNPEDIPEPEFIQYLSEQAPDGDRRHAVGFYLNPRMDRQMSLFIDFINEMQADRLNFAAKAINRRREAKRLRRASTLKIRTEGLVVSASSGNADRVLKIILNSYRRLPDIFAGRAVPILAAQLAPGIAISTRLNLILKR